jgi:hypothetical protein
VSLKKIVSEMLSYTNTMGIVRSITGLFLGMAVICLEDQFLKNIIKNRNSLVEMPYVKFSQDTSRRGLFTSEKKTILREKTFDSRGRLKMRRCLKYPPTFYLVLLSIATLPGRELMDA